MHLPRRWRMEEPASPDDRASVLKHLSVPFAAVIRLLNRPWFTPRWMKYCESEILQDD